MFVRSSVVLASGVAVTAIVCARSQFAGVKYRVPGLAVATAVLALATVTVTGPVGRWDNRAQNWTAVSPSHAWRSP